MNTKVCNKCGIKKPLSEYHTDKTLSSGVRGICKVCGLSYVKMRYHTDTEYKKLSNERSRLYYLARKERDPNYRRIPLSEQKIRVFKERPVKIPVRKMSRVCRIIQEHHLALKDDPEHLPTSFIQNLIGVECSV
jgi:serine kinase of HPr protein (carbohydrate metabolism regulator)